MTSRAWTSTGVSSGGISSHSSMEALSSSLSTSYQRTGSRLRSSRSRTSKARRDARGAISRITPCPASSCQARRASRVAKMCSPNSGQRATMSRRSARSKAIVSVGSTATQALIVGSPVISRSTRWQRAARSACSRSTRTAYRSTPRPSGQCYTHQVTDPLCALRRSSSSRSPDLGDRGRGASYVVRARQPLPPDRGAAGAQVTPGTVTIETASMHRPVAGSFTASNAGAR